MTAKQYRQKMLKDAFEQRLVLDLDKTKEQACPNCQEALVFAFQVGDNTISLGLSTILECLKIAEDEGYLPKIDEGKEYGSFAWWPRAAKLCRDYNLYR